MNELDYYISWSAQNTALSIPIANTDGVYFIKENGEKIVDLISTSYQASFGHSNQKIIEAIKKQLDRLAISSPKNTFQLKDNVSNKLISLLGFNCGKIFYTVSGAESVENALKIARQIKGRNKVLARKVSYHGASLGALSVTGDWRNTAHQTIDDWTIRIPEPSEDPECIETRKIIKENDPKTIAAFCLETITGANGVYIAPEKWWKEISKLCLEFDLFLILDEVLTGFARTNKSFAFQHYGLKPDLVCMSKAISGGYLPFGAVYTSENIASYFDKDVLSCGLTNYAHPLGLAALDAVIEIMRNKNFQTHLNQLETVFKNGLASIENLNSVLEVRSKGLLGAIDLADNTYIKPEVFLDKGIHLQSKQGMLVLAPILTMEREVLNQAMRTVKNIIEEYEN